MSGPTMTCPKCGSDMNHQAEKLTHPATEVEAARMTPALDGVVLIVFACPQCGWIDSVRQTGSAPEHS